MRLPHRGESFLIANGRHQLVWSRWMERKQSVCFPQVFDNGDPEPLPGSRRGRRFFLKLAHSDRPWSSECLRTEAMLLKLPPVAGCRAIAELVAEGEWQGLPFLVKRQVSGATLAQALADRMDLPTDTVGELLHEMALAAEACRQAGYSVADWSPTNVNVPGRVLLDLGGAARLEEAVRYAREESPDRGQPASPAVDVRGICMLALDIYAGDALARLRRGEQSYDGIVASLRAHPPSECPAELWRAVIAGLGGTLPTAADLLQALAKWAPAELAAPASPPKRRGLLARMLGRS